MAYNRINHLHKVADIQNYARQYYEQGRQDRNWRWVWRNHIYPKCHISYFQFTRMNKIDVSKELEQEQTAMTLKTKSTE